MIAKGVLLAKHRKTRFTCNECSPKTWPSGCCTGFSVFKLMCYPWYYPAPLRLKFMSHRKSAPAFGRRFPQEIYFSGVFSGYWRWRALDMVGHPSGGNGLAVCFRGQSHTFNVMLGPEEVTLPRGHWLSSWLWWAIVKIWVLFGEELTFNQFNNRCFGRRYYALSIFLEWDWGWR